MGELYMYVKSFVKTMNGLNKNNDYYCVTFILCYIQSVCMYDLCRMVSFVIFSRFC